MNRRPGEGGTTAPDGRPWSEQPRWRRDFPIGVEADEYVSRRDFTSFMVLISSAFACGQLWIVAQSLWQKRLPAPPRLEIARLSELPVGGVTTFRYPTASDACVLVRLDEQGTALLRKVGGTRVAVTLSHTDNNALAVAVILRE